MAKKKRVRTDDPVKCIAHSSRTGKPCNNPPMHGGNVCRMHGGSAGQTRRRAAERIALASDKAAAQLFAFMSDETIPAAVRLAATRDLLDRADVTGKTRIEVDQQAPWQTALAGIIAWVPEGTPMRPFEDGVAADAVSFDAGPDGVRTVTSERVGELAGHAAATEWVERPGSVDYGPAAQDWSDAEAYGHDLPAPADPTAPKPKKAKKPRDPDAAPVYVNGDDTPSRNPYAPTPRQPRRGRSKRR